jgi:stage II sporulation protein P
MTANKTCLAILFIVGVLGFSVCFAQGQNDHRCYNLVDDTGKVVYITGWPVKVGDQCLTAENKRYEVTAINGNRATVKFLESVNLAQYDTIPYAATHGISLISTAYGESKGKVAIYHTHDDESYVPTDGKSSIYGDGGIFKVGHAFANALRADGMIAIHSYAKHDPHDDMAYERSRRTVVELLKQKPDALFDVHRDATPPEVYSTVINGQKVTKVQLVVGKYGPTGKQIEDYALQLKAAADKLHPGLIKGIFFAKGGSYNQDLFPRSMLLEVGSDTNDRPSAERGVALFADAVPVVIGKTAANQTNQAGAAGVGTVASGFSGAVKSIGWILGLFIVGMIAFLYLSTGSGKEARSKLKQFTSTEFANFFAPKQKKLTKENGKEQDQDQDKK